MSENLHRVLLVDDDDLIAEFAILLLEGAGFEVLYCRSGKAAIEKAPGFGPQLMLLDFIMPIMDGAATLDALRGQPETAETPAIFITGKACGKENLEALIERGAQGAISKPFHPQKLISEIKTIWKQHAL